MTDTIPPRGDGIQLNFAELHELLQLSHDEQYKKLSDMPTDQVRMLKMGTTSWSDATAHRAQEVAYLDGTVGSVLRSRSAPGYNVDKED